VEEDHKYTHFLWLSEVDNPDRDFIVFWFYAVLFGSFSSLFMLHATLTCHLTTEISDIASNILANLYVDNVVLGCTSETDAIQYYTEARDLTFKANFDLRSWASNSPQLMTKASEDKVADINTAVNILGLLWNIAKDKLSLLPKPLKSLDTTAPTK